MILKIWLIVLVATTVTGKLIASIEENGLNIKKAIDILDDVRIVAEKYCCEYGGKHPTELSWGFTVIANSGNSSEIFNGLVESGSVYGLIGLFHSDRKMYYESLHRFSGNDPICYLSKDMFVEFEVLDFIEDILERSNDTLYRSLIFAELPDLRSTIKLDNPCAGFDKMK